jgi:hypothetical protein
MLLQYEGNEAVSPIEQRLLQLLEGKSILAYRSNTKKEMSKFARLLRATLNSTL